MAIATGAEEDCPKAIKGDRCAMVFNRALAIAARKGLNRLITGCVPFRGVKVGRVVIFPQTLRLTPQQKQTDQRAAIPQTMEQDRG